VSSSVNGYRRIAIDPVNSSTVYVGVPGSGLIKTTDGGSTWTPINNGLTSLSVLDLVLSPPLTVYAATMGGVFKSTNGGNNWSAANGGLGAQPVYSLAIDPASPSTLYAGALGFSDGYVTKLNPAGSAILYSTFLGGGGTDAAGKIFVDATGNAYITGHTNSMDFPTADAFQATNQGLYDAFVSKLNSSGNGLVYSTYLGGSANDYGQGVAVDNLGSAYVTGYTFSADFPTMNPALGRCCSESYIEDVFVTRLSSSGASLAYSTYLGRGRGEAIAVDALRMAYVTGEGTSDFSHGKPIPSTGFYLALVAKLDASGSIIYYTGFGRGNFDHGYGIALDSSGAAYVTGSSSLTANAELMVFKVEDQQPVTEIQLNKESYTIGETVSAPEFRLRNPGPAETAAEVKVWLALPGMNPVSIVSMGSDGSFKLPGNFNQNFGPFTLFTVSASMPSGDYEFSARMLDPVDGRMLNEDLNPFEVSGTSASPGPIRRAVVDPPPRIDIKMSSGNYFLGQTASTTEFKITNSGSATVPVEVKVWLGTPALWNAAINLGSDGTFQLPAGYLTDLGAFPLFPVTPSTPGGRYEFSSRVLDPVTGKQLSHDYNMFVVNIF
jgi:hypothetical protein